MARGILLPSGLPREDISVPVVFLGGQSHLSQLSCEVETCPRWWLWTDGGGHELWMGTQKPAGVGRACRGKGEGDLAGRGMGITGTPQTASCRDGWCEEGRGCSGGDRDRPEVGGAALHLQ